MAYATGQDIVDRYGLDYLVIPSDDNCDGFADSTKVAAALADASAEIDKFLSTRFEVPLTDVGTNAAWDWVVRCTCDLAVFYMAQTWDTMTDLIKMRAEACMKQLERIANGEINVGGPAAAQGSAKVCANPRVLTRRELCGVL